MLDTVVKLQMLQERYKSETEKLFIASLKDAMEIITGKLATTHDADNIKRLNALKAIIEKEVSDIYTEMRHTMQKDMSDWMDLQYEMMHGALVQETGIALAFASLPKDTIKEVIALDAIHLVGDKAYTIDELFNNASTAQINRYKQIIAGGLASNDGFKNITKRLKDANATATTDIRAITHTLIRSARDNADKVAYKQFNVTSFKSVATLDSRTSFLCASLDGKVYNMDYEDIPNRPPRHFRCRSMIVKNTGIESTRAQNGDTRGQISNKTTFNEWFAKQSPKFQEGYLGKARYELYKSGRYSIKDFVDVNTGEKFSISEIKGVLGGGSEKNKIDFLSLISKDNNYKDITPISSNMHKINISSEMNIKEVEGEIIGARYEHGVVFKDGSVLSTFTSNDIGSVMVKEDFKGQFKDAVFTHNHPMSDTLSSGDIISASRFNMKEIRAVLPNGEIHIARRTSNKWDIDADNFIADRRDIFMKFIGDEDKFIKTIRELSTKYNFEFKIEKLK